MNLRKISSLLSLGFLFIISIGAQPANRVKEYTLENNMKIFILEDSSDALVHLEYTCHAGFSSQTQETNGYFKLFSRLVESGNPNLKFTDVECNADSSRYILEIAPQELNKTLENLAQAVFAPAFTDEVFSEQLNALKNEASANASDLGNYINAAIDSRVFSEAPWKHDSGIYPPIFKRTSSATARNIIKEISDRWYTPQNSALFISGNINNEKLLLALKATFGTYYSSYKKPVEKESLPINAQRKYVFHHKDISSELTQIVIQYTMLGMEESDLFAASLNNDSSTFKQKLLELTELNIPGAEYINVSSAHKRNSSRLIIQALMQPPENKKDTITSQEQVQKFFDIVKNIPNEFNPLEFQYGKLQLQGQIEQIAESPLKLMNQLSSFWALESYYPLDEEDLEIFPDSELTSLLFSRSRRIDKIDQQAILDNFAAEDPFIFIIISEKDFKANKKAYKEAGYEEINENNSSWYVQKMYREIRDQLKPQDQNYYASSSKVQDNAYFQRNLEEIKPQSLENGIQIVSKKNINSKGISLLLSIKGGKLNSANENGLEEVMVNLMATNLQRELNKKIYQGLITGNPRVSSKTEISTSSILINFDMEDAQAVCQTLSDTIIYGEIPPAYADRAVSSKQYRKRLENGDATNQIFSAAVKTIYGKGDFSKIFDTEKDILENTDFTSILQAYPNLLDASRYNAIVCGNFDDSLLEYLSKALGLFAKNDLELNTGNDKESLPKNKKITAKIRHTFLTDIPAEEAGPQPAVLIPTTEFLDPALYISQAPEDDEKKLALFKAIFNYLQDDLESALEKNSHFNNSSVKLELPQSKMNFACIYIMNVSHTREADSIYRSCVQGLLRRMQEAGATEGIIQEIKNAWTLKQMKQSSSNEGTAYLIQKGFELKPDQPQPDYYLQEYNFIQTATVQDFLEVMDSISDRANLRVYSLDSKN